MKVTLQESGELHLRILSIWRSVYFWWFFSKRKKPDFSGVKRNTKLWIRYVCHPDILGLLYPIGNIPMIGAISGLFKPFFPGNDRLWSEKNILISHLSHFYRFAGLPVGKRVRLLLLLLLLLLFIQENFVLKIFSFVLCFPVILSWAVFGISLVRTLFCPLKRVISLNLTSL